MKVSELEGALLDYWVCRAEGWIAHHEFGDLVWHLPPTPDEGEIGLLMGDSNFQPSSDWAHGGPIIERERISVMTIGQEWVAGFNPSIDSRIVNDGGGYFDDMSRIEMEFENYGDAHLIAAMRAFVASKFGDDVPDEVAL